MCAVMPDKQQKFKFPNRVKYSIDILTQNLNLNLSSIHKHNTVYKRLKVKRKHFLIDKLHFLNSNTYKNFQYTRIALNLGSGCIRICSQ